MNSLIANLDVFRDYFTGKIDIDAVEKYLQTYNYKPEEFENDFYKQPVNTDENIHKVIELLLQLNVDRNLWPAYFSSDLSLYSLLKQLARDHEYSIQLHQLVDLLIRKKFENLIALAWRLGIALSITLTVLGVTLYTSLSPVFHFLFDTANILPILGTVFSVISLVSSLYINHLYDRRPRYKIYRDDAFLIATHLLNIIGKLILVFVHAGLAHLTAVFLILPALISTAKELGYLIELNKKYKVEPAFEKTDMDITHQQFARHRFDYLKQRNSLIINLSVACILTALALTSSFLPVGIVLTISISVSIACVYLLKLLALHINQVVMAKKLQTALKEIGELYEVTKTAEAASNSFITPMGYDLQPNNTLADNEPFFEETVGKTDTHHSIDMLNSKFGFFNHGPTPSDSPYTEAYLHLKNCTKF